MLQPGVKESLPRMPPNKKTSKVFPSSGERSLAAAGSSRHTRDLSLAYISSTPCVEGVKAGTAASRAGTWKAGGKDDRQKRAPAVCDSLAMVMYSSSDHGPSSSSRCSTIYVLPLIVVGFRKVWIKEIDENTRQTYNCHCSEGLKPLELMLN